MAQGVCDLPIPPVVVNGAKEAIDNGFNIYTPTEGLPQLKEAILSKMQRFYGLEVKSQEILVSDGATGAFYTACLALLNPGDEVILFEPYYGYHKATLESVGAKPVYVKLDPPNWKIDFDALKSAITSKTRAVLICNPSNPCGKVFTKDELDSLGALLEAHDLFLFSDEMYEHFIYDNKPHIPALSVSKLKERSILISGFSKVYSVTGWRLGYAIAPQHVIEAMAHFNDLIYVCAPAPLQMGVAQGIMKLGNSYYKELAATHQLKRDLFCAALTYAGLTPSIPDGAYYVMADISSVAGDDDKAKVMHILEKTGVAAVAGRAFYHDDSGKNIARFCYSKPLDVLEDAAQRIKAL